MIHALSIFLLVGLLARAEDGLFAFDDIQKPRVSMDGHELVMRMGVKKLEVPKSKRVLLFDSEGSDAGRYTIQVDLTESPDEGWVPILVLGDSVFLEVGVSRSERGSTLSFGTDDPDLASELLRRMGKVFRLSHGQVLDVRQMRVELRNAPEPPPVTEIRKSANTVNSKPESAAPVDGGGR